MAGAPQPPQIPPGPVIPPNQRIESNDTPDKIGIKVNAAAQLQKTDGLQPLAKELQEVIQTIGTTSSDMRKTLDALYKTYTDAVDDRKHAVSDVEAIVRKNQQATVDLAAKEQQLTKADQLRIRAEQEKVAADAKFQQLQEKQAELEQKAREASAKAVQLESSNKQLVELHKSQIVDIHSNIQTLSILKRELLDLQNGILKIHQQAVAFGCIKLYTQHPLLIKARQIALASQSIKIYTGQGGPIIINMDYLIRTSTNLQGLITQSLKETDVQIRSILEHLQTITPNGPFPFWQNYLTKVDETERFLTSPIVNTNLTGLQYLIYCWTVELLPENALPQIDSRLSPTLKQIERSILTQ